MSQNKPIYLLTGQHLPQGFVHVMTQHQMIIDTPHNDADLQHVRHIYKT